MKAENRLKNHADALIVSNSEQVRYAICAGAANCIITSEKPRARTFRRDAFA